MMSAYAWNDLIWQRARKALGISLAAVSTNTVLAVFFAMMIDLDRVFWSGTALFGASCSGSMLVLVSALGLSVHGPSSSLASFSASSADSVAPSG